MTTTEVPVFASLLKRYRLHAGLTQEALAEQARLSVRAISDLERGVKHRPRRDTVQLLAEALRLSPRERAVFETAARYVDDARATIVPVQTNPGAIPRPPLVGRAGEMAVLERHLAGKGPAVLLLAGEPGIGKSRLLYETARDARGQGWTVLEGGCQRRGGQEPYAPLLDALKRHIQKRSPVYLRTELRDCAWLVRLLPELADGPIEPLPSWTLSAKQEQRLMAEAVGSFLTNAAGPAGTLLVLDDLQWAGPDALDLLTALLRLGSDIPLRVVGAYRSTETHEPLSATLADLAHAGRAVRHILPPFTGEEAEHFLDSLLSDLAMREPTLRCAGGMPFFLVSYAQGLRQGHLDGVPWDLAHSIRQRIAVLPQAAQEMLRTAAIVGRRVTRALLVAMSPGPAEELLSALEAACRAELLMEDGPTAYQFAHDVIREVVEADLSAARGALLHRRVAETLERAPEGSEGELLVEVLAYHYARADARDKAVFYLEQAGDKARMRYANVAAQRYYQETVDRLDDMGHAADAARVRERLGAVLDTMARYDAALTVFERAAEAYRTAGDVESLGRATAQIGWMHVNRSTPEAGLECLNPVVRTIAARGPSHGLAALYDALAALYIFSSRYAEALSASKRAADLARAVEDTRTLASAEMYRGVVLWSLGQDEEALQAEAEAIVLAEDSGNLNILCKALDHVGSILEERGEFAASGEYAERGIVVAERQGDPAWIAFQTTRRGMAAFYTGEWSQARGNYERAVALSRPLGPYWGAPLVLLDLGRLCLAEGRWDEASQYLEEALAAAQASQDISVLREAQVVLAERDVLTRRPDAAVARLVPLLDRPGIKEGAVTFVLPRLAWAYLELGEVERAAATVGQALARAREENKRLYVVDALRVQAMVMIQQGCWPEAARALEEGLSLARTMRYPYAEARLLSVCSHMHAAKGETGSAREHLEAALAIFRRLGARKDSERAEQAIGDLSPP